MFSERNKRMPLVPYKNKYDNHPLIVSCGKGQGFYPRSFNYLQIYRPNRAIYKYNV